MARRVVGDRLSRCAAEVRIETRFLTDGPEELAWIHDCRRDFFCGRTVYRFDKRRVFPSHHHRARRVDCNDLRASFDERQQDPEVRLDMPAKRLQVTAFPGRHAAALKAACTTNVDAVTFEHFDRIAADLRFVVLNVACLKQDRFASRFWLYLSGARSPSLERRAGKLRKQLVAMNAENLLQKNSMQANAIGDVGDAKTSACHGSGGIRIAKHTIAQAESFPLRFLRNIALDQTWKIQLELVSIALGVGTLDLAELALKAGVHDFGCVGCGDLPDIAVLPVDGRKKIRKAVTVFEAETAAVADFERPPDFLLECLRIPIFGFRGIVGKRIRGLISDVFGWFHPRSRSRNRFQKIAESTRVRFLRLSQCFEP